jgi:hypothetical protein
MHCDCRERERTALVDRRPKGAVVMAACSKNAETVGDVWIQMFGESG